MTDNTTEAMVQELNEQLETAYLQAVEALANLTDRCDQLGPKETGATASMITALSYMLTVIGPSVQAGIRDRLGED